MQYRQSVMLAIVFIGVALARKKNPDEITQSLEIPKDPPMVAIGETSRLVFHVSPLSAKGLLSQQTREALKAILKENGGAQVIHIRAFVAGSGDLRRVPQIVSEVFTSKKMPLPSLSVVLAGRLSLENAQVVIEAVSVGKREVNPDGLALIQAKSEDEMVSRLAGSTPLIVSCFASSIDAAKTIAARFPAAAVNLVQTRRDSSRAEENCEAVARGRQIKSTRLAFSGTQVAFGVDDRAAILAFQRLDRELGLAGVQSSDIKATHIYALSERFGVLARKVWTGTGQVSVVPFEGVASADGTFAVDVIAALPQ